MRGVDSAALAYELKYSGLEYRVPPHHPDVVRKPFTCSCGAWFKTQRGRSNHFHAANNRRRRMGI